MGQILKTKTLPSGKIVVHLELELQEAQQLKNHAKRIHLFSENLCIHQTNIIGKGTNFGTKLVLIPLSLKSRKKAKVIEVAYQKVEVKDKIFYISIAKKDPLEQ